VTERFGRLEVDAQYGDTPDMWPQDPPPGFLVGTGGTACRPSTETGPEVHPRRQ